MSIKEDAEVWRLRGQLADLLDAYPVETWPAALFAAVVQDLNLYAAGLPQDPPVMAKVLELVRGE